MKPLRTHVKRGGQALPEAVGGCAGLESMLPVRDAMDILYGKWKLPIMGALFSGPKRFKVLQRQIKNITAKMLSKELKDLEMNDLVTRTAYDTAPVSVEYALTTYGHSLESVVSALHDWGLQHRKRIIAKGRKGQQSGPTLRSLRLVQDK